MEFERVVLTEIGELRTFCPRLRLKIRPLTENEIKNGHFLVKINGHPEICYLEHDEGKWYLCHGITSLLVTKRVEFYLIKNNKKGN